MNLLELGLLGTGGLGLLGQRPAVVYLLRDEFTTDESAPLTSPRDAEPGPGTLTVTDTENNLSISGSELVCAGGKATPAYGDPAMYHASGFSRETGRAHICKVLSADDVTTVGWDNSVGTAAGFYGGIWLTGGNIRATDAGGGTGDLVAFSAGTDYEFANILRSAGAFHIVKGGAFADWTLLWVSDTTANATMYPVFGNYNAVVNVDNFRVTDLRSPWDSDYGIATDRLAGSRSAGDTFTHEADFLGEFTVDTLPSSGQIEWWFRKQDGSNYWAVTVDSNGDIDLDEVVSGSPTQRGTSATAVSAGNRIVVVADGTDIKVYVAKSQEISYASASNFQNETAGELDTEGTGGAVSDIVTWPRVLSGSAKSELDRV